MWFFGRTVKRNKGNISRIISSGHENSHNTVLVNLSLETGTMPCDMKVAMINPILKKPLLDKEIFSNYRPVSNLTYVSKLIQRAISKQLVDHLESNNLAETFQSAYKQYHSTETALTVVTNNILTVLDRKQAVLLVSLDLSAAFDMVDHTVLLKQLEVRVGLGDIALHWMESYLTQCYQHVSAGGGKSSSRELKWGVPRESHKDRCSAQFFFQFILCLWAILLRNMT